MQAIYRSPLHLADSSLDPVTDASSSIGSVAYDDPVTAGECDCCGRQTMRLHQAWAPGGLETHACDACANYDARAYGECPECSGTGRIDYGDGFHSATSGTPCEACNGTGEA